MGPAPFSTSRRIIFLDWICVLRAQKCWTAAALLLLLRLITLCSCLGKKSLSFVCLSLTIRTRTHPYPVISPSPGEECVLGVVGRPVSLPCLQPKLLSLVNFSIEWRRGDAVVLRSVFERSRNVEELGADGAAMSDDAAQTGNFSLELPTVDPREAPVNYSLFIISEESRSAALCTVCLQIAGQCQAHRKCSGELTAFFCRSGGGFPEPKVHWVINFTEEPPEGSVRTVAQPLPDSHLYNVTSHLMVNISQDSSVSCTIENQPLNETWTSTNGAPNSPVVGRASEAMWIFSTVLCAVVGVMVAVGVVYQIHLDRMSKRKKCEYQHQQKKRGGPPEAVGLEFR
uniref:Ig-like domain-containing protein n=1 Tax=Mola mola TaxID=94237 RepID=A0A3Q3W149_MOLML